MSGKTIEEKAMEDFMATYQALRAVEPMIMTFGKHKGKTYEYIFSYDKPYVAWALGQDPKYFKRFQDYCKKRITDETRENVA